MSVVTEASRQNHEGSASFSTHDVGQVEVVLLCELAPVQWGQW